MSVEPAAYVLGVGMVPFHKAGTGEPYHLMAAAAARAALADAGVDHRDIEQSFAGYCLGESCAGQRALYEVGLSGAPIVNVNNNCATGSTTLYLARQAIAAGEADCALAVGFEEMEARPAGPRYADRPSPVERHAALLERLQPGEDRGALFAARLFGGAGREHQARFGTRHETFAAIAVKARRHAAHNPDAVFREPLTVEQVLASRTVFDPLTKLQCCPPTSGAAAAVVCSAAFARRRGGAAAGAPVEIAAQAMTTDRESSFADSLTRLVGYGLAAEASARAYAQAGAGPGDVDVVELHDCFTTNELLSYEALGLCGEGEGERLVADGETTYGGRWVVNPSGGLLSKGHPLGATGLAQCAELVWQLRGRAGARQVEGARLALQHNLGLGGACVVTLYRRA